MNVSISLSRCRWLVSLLTVSIALIHSGGSAMAGIMFFENPPPGQEGHFNWHVGERDDPITFEQWLDITRPSTDQFGLANGNSVGQLYRENGGDSLNITSGGSSVALAVGTLSTRAFSFGELISVDADYDSSAIHVFLPGFQSQFEEGVLAYIGVRTESDHYGWIAVIRTRFSFEAIAWAYQTEAGVPIRAGEIPAIGGIALFGLFGLSSRRRRTP